MAKLTVVESTKTEAPEVLETEQIKADWVGIKEATTLLGVAYQQYTRRLILEGRLEAVKLQYPHYQKWVVSKAGITVYLRTRRRTTEGRRWVLRADLEAEDQIRAALDQAGVEYTLELAYQPKDSDSE